MIRNDGETKIFSENQAKKQIKCYVKESFPHFLVTDGYFYVPCYFTKKAVDDFKTRCPTINITELKRNVIVITHWDLEINKVNSGDTFTSYGGIEVRLIVKGFKHLQLEKDKVTLNRYPVNLYRDDEIKTLIQNYTFKCVSNMVNDIHQESELPDISTFQSRSKLDNCAI